MQSECNRCVTKVYFFYSFSYNWYTIYSRQFNLSPLRPTLLSRFTCFVIFGCLSKLRRHKNYLVKRYSYIIGPCYISTCRCFACFMYLGLFHLAFSSLVSGLPDHLFLRFALNLKNFKFWITMMWHPITLHTKNIFVCALIL